MLMAHFMSSLFLSVSFSYIYSANQIGDSISSIKSNSSGISGLGSDLRGKSWTPPLSGDRGTPSSYTEGTPSLTESSESSDVG